MTEPPGAIYVYGVTPGAATAIPPMDGVDRAPVHALRHAGLAALVSPIGKTDLRAADVRAHWRVLEHAFEHATVLPVRFGTLMESEDEVRRRLLEPNEDRLTELLQAMNGLIQLNVKGRYDEESLLRGILREAPALARLRERAQRSGAMADQVALGQQVERAIEQRRAQDTATVRGALEDLAVAARDEQVRHPDAFNLAFLVARKSTDAFSQRVGRVRDQLEERIEIRYVGPVPPFSFAESELGEGERAWA
ncbi:MAG TPA: GvpL/GvpF family gas vesicle protein [Solirubrobacteraceae bacterium]|nr:GvpL/GvpF family gas vesicle protein [Solirubrobacteraceae bacterium]